MSPTVPATPTATTARAAGHRSRWMRRIVVAAVGLSLSASAALVLGPDGAGASAPTAHDPFGSAPTVTKTAAGMRFTGWAADPDSITTNLTVSAVMDGAKTLARTTTTLANSRATKLFGTSRTPAYRLDVAVPRGNHTVCLVLWNVGPGLAKVSRCVATPWGRALTGAQRAAHSPVGAMTGAATPSGVRVTGWATDPDLVTRRTSVVVYVDGAAATTRSTVRYTGVRPSGAGSLSRYDVTVPTTSGTHVGCVWVVNAGMGSNTFLGCRTVDTRSPYNRTPAATKAPAVNGKVAALARKQIGKPYVWGATGPRSFDCSGLVMWSYGRNGRTTPRVSQDQIKAARLIPASHARAGDLVFYHDNVGDVYHVGIFLRPGMSVAAIDTNQGVDYQPIWDSTATYGSFTHT